MTINEARYVVANRHLYADTWVQYALDILDDARRQGIIQ